MIGLGKNHGNSRTREELFGDLGFSIVDAKQDHVFPFIVEKYKYYIYEREPWFESMPPEVFSAIEKQLGWHLLITAKLQN
jgi:hypothetical protein